MPKKAGAVVIVSDDVVHIGERYYIKATTTLIDTETGEQIDNTAFAREEDVKKGMDSSQVTGATSSYARKYALNGLFCIDDVKDADSRDNRQKEAKEQQKAEEERKKVEKLTISEVKVKALENRCKDDNVDTNKIMQLYKVKSLSELTELKYSNINQHWEEIRGA